MILQGNQRGGARELARHLLKDENDHIDVHDIRGFAANDVTGALDEVYAISRGTRAKQYLYSLSLNPPANETVPTESFEDAINRVEKKLGLSGQPRVIVFHEKRCSDGQQRRHAHAVWSRIDGKEMKAIPLPYTKLKLQEISRDLYIEHGWDMPTGFIDKNKRNLQNFTLAEWQQAKRNDKDPRHIKKVLQNSWATSVDQTSLVDALKERGYVLARGDRRSFVALDMKFEPYALPKWIGIKTKEVRERVTDPDKLPTVDEAKAQIAKDVQKRLTDLKQQQAEAITERQNRIEEKRRELIKQQSIIRERLKATQAERWVVETRARQNRFNKGFRGLIDQFTGRKKRIREQNERETLHAHRRDQKQRDDLVFKQIQERQALQLRSERLEAFRQQKQQGLKEDIEHFIQSDKDKEHGLEM